MMLGQCFSFCVFTRPGPIAADLRRCINSAATWGTPAIKSNYSSVTATRGPCGPQNWLSLIQDVRGRPSNAAPPTRQNLCAELLAALSLDRYEKEIRATTRNSECASTCLSSSSPSRKNKSLPLFRNLCFPPPHSAPV